MSDYIYESFLAGLKKRKTKKTGWIITPMDFESFSVAGKPEKITLSQLANLAEWATDTIKMRAHQLDFIATYHKNSPRHWRKDEAEVKNYDEEKVYEISINLERFIPSSNQDKYVKKKMDFYIPDNYELAKKVFRKYKGDKVGIKDTSFRECAVWQSTSYKKIKALGDYIENTIVIPYLNDVLKTVGAIDVKFVVVGKTNKIEFVYPKKAK